MPMLPSKSCLTGFCALKHNRATLVAVSSPERVVKSIQVTARRSQAACHCFLIDRRVFSVSARRFTAGRLTRVLLTHSKSSGTPGLRTKWDDILKSNVTERLGRLAPSPKMSPHTRLHLLRLQPITIQNMAVFAVVSSLQNHCLRAVACQLPDHETSLGLLPVEIKAKLVNLLSKRGLLADSNLANVSSDWTSVRVNKRINSFHSGLTWLGRFPSCSFTISIYILRRSDIPIPSGSIYLD